MKVWRGPGITGKLFLAIFATYCIVLLTLLIGMRGPVRVSFERQFIDYIKHGNEQRLQMLGDARWATSTSNTATGVFTQQRSLRFPDSAFI